MDCGVGVASVHAVHLNPFPWCKCSVCGEMYPLQADGSLRPLQTLSDSNGIESSYCRRCDRTGTLVPVEGK